MINSAKKTTVRVINKEEIKAVFRQALKHAFNETGVKHKDFTWFSNKPLQRS